jgi:hypothetical protein
MRVGLVPELDVVSEKRILGVFGDLGSFRVRAPQYARFARQHSPPIGRPCALLLAVLHSAQIPTEH